MNVLPALADYLHQYFPEFYWVESTEFPTIYIPISACSDTMRLNASIAQHDNLLQITDNNRPIHRNTVRSRLGDNNPEIVDLFDKHFSNKVLCILHMWIAQQNPAYPGITSSRIDFI